jgi:hypothetical protein
MYAMLKLHYGLGALFLAVCTAALALDRGRPDPSHPATPLPGAERPASTAADEWFAAVKPFCNALEVETATAQLPPPEDLEGRGYAAACFAIAGKMDRARGFLLQVPEALRWRAAGIVFEVGHPIADAGDDRSAGPIMELVVEFWPNHYMALYHAGAAAFGLGQRQAAERHLREFLRHYSVSDGWRASALDLLEQLGTR